MRKTAIALALLASVAASPALAAYQVQVWTANTGVGFNADQSAGTLALFANGTNSASKATFTY